MWGTFDPWGFKVSLRSLKYICDVSEYTSFQRPVLLQLRFRFQPNLLWVFPLIVLAQILLGMNKFTTKTKNFKILKNEIMVNGEMRDNGVHGSWPPA